jgi:hypothetical protein
VTRPRKPKPKPPKLQPKTYGILMGLRALDAEQKARWEAAAARDDRSFASWARRLLDAGSEAAQ